MLGLHHDVHLADGILHSDTEVTRPEVEVMTDETLSTLLVDDLRGLRHVAPTPHYPNADLGLLDGQQRNVIIAIAKPMLQLG
jgi:hypothetical protein